MKQCAMLFPDELYEVMNEARYKERRSSVSEFVREAVKTYLRNTGYQLPEEFETIKRGHVLGTQKRIPVENLNEAIETYVAPKEPTTAWSDIPKWGE